MNRFQIKRYFSYFIKSRHWKGFGIHSPFVFDFVANLMNEKYEYYDFQRIHSWKNAMLTNKIKIEVNDFGAGSSVTNFKKRKIGNIVSSGSIPKRYGELLFRMIDFFSPVGILELGTSFGISALYLGLPKRSAKLVTIEGCPNIANWANDTFNEFEMKNIELLVGKFSDLIPQAINKLPSLDFVFFDGDHRKESTLEYFNECLKFAHNDTIFVFDDIHWSQGMEEAWNEIVANPKVTVSIDIFRFGIVFFRKECQKEGFLVRF